MNILQTLASLSANGRPPSDQDMLKWANETARSKHPETTPLRSFKDPAISSGIFFLNLVDSMRPGIVDQSLVINPPKDYEEQRQNGASTPEHCDMCSTSLTRPRCSKTRDLNRT